jgi:sugar phosphate isomerase/epimerase
MRSVKTEADTSVYAAKILMEKNDVQCITLHAATFPISDLAEVHRAVYYGKISAFFAHILSAPIMVIHSFVSRQLPLEMRLEVLGKVFGEIKPYAESLGLKLALENLSYASGGFGKNVGEFEEIFDAIDQEKKMGITLDFCHSTATRTTFSLLERYHDRLCNVHMSNRGHRPFAEATSELCDFLNALQGFKYNGPITLELSRKCSNDEILRTKTVLEDALASI